MGVTLFDQVTNEVIFDVNFWHWRALVEAVRALDVFSIETVAQLHEPFVGELTQDEARHVADAIRERLLPTLTNGERVLLDGTRTTEPDDGTFHRDTSEQHRNYSTTRAILALFADCCASCGGFRVS
jgi:hypothetical protein